MNDDNQESRTSRRRARSGWKRPRRILGLWARLSLLLAVIVVSIFFAISLVAKAIRPYREASVQSSQLKDTRRQNAQITLENADLQRRIQYLKTPDGIASEARTYGYLRPGERPIMVQGLDEPELSSAPAASALAAHGNTARRFWHHLTGH
ncbi:MAG: septum formation initiator family protein [Armatimonadota bacterium]|nr:septum formation initiator family protein [Armatimonadota bacterium]